MASLAQREDLAGKVQMIYIDPPYGIKFGSNFQPEIGQRDVKDTEPNLSREPETIKAYRDTWLLGTHSYLAYLRDRIHAARALLHQSGSIFVQISDDNLHRVRSILDDVFGVEQFVATITVKKTGGQSSTLIPRVADYLLWYCRDRDSIQYNSLYSLKTFGVGEGSGRRYDRLEEHSGHRRALSPAEKDDVSLIPSSSRVCRLTSLISAGYRKNTTVPFDVFGRSFFPGSNSNWKTTIDGLKRLSQAERIHPRSDSIEFLRYLDDFAAYPITSLWVDVAGAADKQYVVQTASKVIERCVLMTTRAGDIVFDPTCGSGTTAYVAEQWGRRWITADTSRVAIAIARQRLMTAAFEFYELKNADKGVSEGFNCKSVPHVTLRSIAQNPTLDPIFAEHAPLLEKRLALLNQALGDVGREVRQKLAGKLAAKQKAEGKRAVTDADKRRWMLPKEAQQFEHWTVPFDTDPDYPKALVDAVVAYRAAWRAKMDAVNGCIEANAEPEELVDQPEVVSGIVRVSGPFTVEAVQPPEMSLGAAETPIGGGPEELEAGFGPDGGEVATHNTEAYLDQMLRLLRVDGVRFPSNRQMEFTRLEPITGRSGAVHAEGRWRPKDENDPEPDGPATVCVAFGPQYGPVTARQVEMLLRAASRRGYDDLVIAGFTFDGAAQTAIEEAEHPNVRIHMAHIRPDVNPGMNGLLKEQPGSQLFTVFGQPRTRLEGPDRDGEYTVTMEGVDIYNPVDNSVTPTRADKVAAWFIDGDYDGRTFCITQAFFPDRDAWEKLASALKGVIDEERFAALSGTVSLPFPVGPNRTVAVKVIDPRGNEVMRLHRLEDGHGG